jgi:hypothetical protein
MVTQILRDDRQKVEIAGFCNVSIAGGYPLFSMLFTRNFTLLRESDNHHLYMERPRS